MAESREELNSLLMKVKEVSEKSGLKFNIQQIKIMASSPITSRQIDGETMEIVTDFIFLGSKIAANGASVQFSSVQLLNDIQLFATLWTPAHQYRHGTCSSMSCSNCCFLTCIWISQEAGQMVWYSHLFQNFPQFIVIHTVKGFGIVNKAEIDVFLELSCFFDGPADVCNLISGSSAFSKTSLNIWSSWFTYC